MRFRLNIYRSALIFTNLPFPEKFLVTHLFVFTNFIILFVNYEVFKEIVAFVDLTPDTLSNCQTNLNIKNQQIKIQLNRTVLLQWGALVQEFKIYFHWISTI